MKLDDAQIKQILLDQNYLDEADFALAEKHEGGLVSFLLDQRLLSKELLGQAIAENFGVKFLDFARQKIDESIFFLIPEPVARKQSVAAVGKLKSGVKIALADPTNEQLIATLERRFDAPVIPYFAFENDIKKEFKRYTLSMKELYVEMEEKFTTAEGDEKGTIIASLVDLILRMAHQYVASDIHVEPYEKSVLVRYRIDGVLHDELTIDKNIYEHVLARIKVLAKMRTDEHRAAQDGKFRFIDKKQDIKVDLRVSIVPTKYGENIVMRLLSAQGRQLTLDMLGLRERDLEVVLEAVKSPHGMILVTGPTGSGKTTTLYGAMRLLNKRDVNVATIEDPVEYDIEGVTQIQVNPKTGLTFAKGLRALVRQDPDIIMVGEIRDEETANIAVNSALTGHLVLSTLHTNDAPTALPRLADMGVEGFLIASTVQVIIAQRLVRKICSSCIVSYEPTPKDKKLLGLDKKEMKAMLKKIGVNNVSSLRLYKGNGCTVCGGSGFKGRIGLFEVVVMSDKIRELIMSHTDADQIKKQAQAEGMTTMFEDGLKKVVEGSTTVQEVLRVAMT